MDKMSFLENLSVSEISFVNRYIEPGENYPLKNGGRVHHGLLFTLAGTETYCFFDREIRAVPQSVLYIPKGEKYSIKFEGDVSRVITVDFETVGNIDRRPFCIGFSSAGEIKSVFEDMERLWIKNEAESTPLIKSCFFKAITLMMLRERTYSNSKYLDLIKPAVDYLHDNFLDPDFRIEALFEISGISARYFETLFFKEFNQTPKQYIISLKIKMAQELLLNEKYSIGDIASKLGYTDVYHFSKIFKAKTGRTPSSFRKEK